MADFPYGKESVIDMCIKEKKNLQIFKSSNEKKTLKFIGSNCKKCTG